MKSFECIPHCIMLICLWTNSIALQAQSRECPYCKGTGKIVKNISASQFGVRTEVKVKCRECGIYYFPSTGHTHIHCSHCRGTGKIGTTAKESSSSMDEYNPESPLAAWGREVASTARYGLPVSQQEDVAFKSFAQINPEGAKNYIAWRNILNATAVYYNRCAAMLTTTPVQDIDQIYLNAEKQLRQYSTGLNLPQDLYTIANQLARQYYNSYISYRKYCADIINLQNIKEQAIDWQLQQNLFY